MQQVLTCLEAAAVFDRDDQTSFQGFLGQPGDMWTKKDVIER